MTLELLECDCTAAVIVTFSKLVTDIDALPPNLKYVALAGMLTDVIIGRSGELLVIVATSPPAGASAVRYARQPIPCPGTSFAGPQISDAIEYVVVAVIVTLDDIGASVPTFATIVAT